MFTCRDFKGKTALSTGPASGMRLLFPQSFAKLGGMCRFAMLKNKFSRVTYCGLRMKNIV